MTKIHWTADGGIEFVVEDSDGNERRVKIRADDDGNLELKGRGPNGEKSGKADPTGNESNPLGK